jgi:hypothetical protein
MSFNRIDRVRVSENRGRIGLYVKGVTDRVEVNSEEFHLSLAAKYVNAVGLVVIALVLNFALPKIQSWFFNEK